MNRRCEYDGVSNEKRIYVMGNIELQPLHEQKREIYHSRSKKLGDLQTPLIIFLPL